MLTLRGRSVTTGEWFVRSVANDSVGVELKPFGFGVTLH